MILEPVFYAPLVEVVLEVARQHRHLLLRLKLSQADAALVLVCKSLWVPLQTVDFGNHLFRLTLLQPRSLSTLEPLEEEVRDKACK